MKLLTRQITGVVYGTDVQMLAFNMHNLHFGAIRMTKDRLCMAPTVMYFPKKHYLLHSMNEEIMLCAQNGLIDYWIGLYIKKKGHQQSTTEGSSEPKIIQLRSIIGILVICSGLLVFSMFVFILEILSPRYASIRNIIDFFTY